jgi:hypothetical protein
LGLAKEEDRRLDLIGTLPYVVLSNEKGKVGYRRQPRCISINNGLIVRKVSNKKVRKGIGWRKERGDGRAR